MSSIKYPVVGGRVVRGTVLDDCGAPAWGDKTQIVSDGVVSVAQTANYDDGQEKTVTNFGGTKCVYVAASAELLNLSLDITFCAVDPEFFTGVTGFPVIYDAATGDAIGYITDRSIRPSDVGFALELWALTQGNAVCDSDGSVPSVYFIWPYLTGGRLGDYTIEDNATTFSITGMVTQDNSRWGEGPYLVRADASGEPAPLEAPIGEKQHAEQFKTVIAPPEVTDGLIPLDNPDDPDATTATAGTPGKWDGVRPIDLAELTASTIVASPTTAWTTGQYVYLGDGSKATWSGTAWVAGTAA